jgi:DNA polymerase III subunit chi
MTQVEFHTGVDDPVHFACRLLRKAYRQGETLLVTAPVSTLEALDRALWTFAAHEFIPHRRMGADMPSPAAVAGTPIWLSEGPAPTPCPPILVNLGAPMPTTLNAFNRVIELLATDPDEVRAGRARWRDYAARGLNIKHHTVGALS